MTNAASFTLAPRTRLTRNLSTLETWGFGVVSHIACPIVVPSVHAALGTKAIFVWVPAVLFGMLINYQVKRLGLRFIDLAGGTSSYTLRLWQNYPWLARYIALSFFSAWLAAVPVYAIVLADLIQTNLALLNLPCPVLALKVGLILLPVVLAFSGARAISLLHLFFIMPVLGLLLLFCVQGLGWLAISPASPGFFPESLALPSFKEWAQWFFLVVWVTYSGESAAAFTADSRNPKGTLQFLPISAWLLVPVFVGGAWVVMRLATDPDLGGDPYMTLLAASQPFWGGIAGVVVTFWLAAICLLNNATVVALCPRMLYQLALDRHLAPVFAVVSRQGVFGPALVLMLVLSFVGLAWGDVSRLVVFGNVTWFFAMMLLHLGLWLQRDQPGVLCPRISLGLFGLEAVVLVVAAMAWGWSDFLLGFLPPLGILVIDRIIRHMPVAFFQPQWWSQRYQSRPNVGPNDSIVTQVMILTILLSGAVLAGWWFGARLNNSTTSGGENLVAILLMAVVFVGVAIACWTSLPAVVSIAEAREATEHLFAIAQDGIVIVDEAGVVLRANPATQMLLDIPLADLVGTNLSCWLPELSPNPRHWLPRNEQSLVQNQQVRTLEISMSDRPHQDFQEYIVILHDITKRKQAERVLQQSEAEMRIQAQQMAAQLVQSEKMSSLGQLVAGIAHEINNPVSFIYGNLDHANDYTRDLLSLLQLYQRHYPTPAAEIQTKTRQMELDFLVQDLPRLLASMQVGADRIQKIVRSLSNFSRKDEAEVKVVDVHAGINSTLLILQHRLKARPEYAEITVHKSYAELPYVECYVGELNQVFMNVIVNAIDALEEKMDLFSSNNTAHHFTPEIWIQTELIDHDHVRICVIDNGPGIPETIRHRLFDPFFTTKPVGKGTGLGLSLSYEIITQKHGGRLYYISELQEGTTFMIEIPLKIEMSLQRRRAS